MSIAQISSSVSQIVRLISEFQSAEHVQNMPSSTKSGSNVSPVEV